MACRDARPCVCGDVDQFIGRDLFNVDLKSLSQIEWRIKGHKLSRESMLQYMASPKGREALEMLGAEKVQKMFPGRKIGEENFVDKLIDNFKTNKQLYDGIFK